ncbi:hypothetical protein G9A89_007840 [Geosiphon pyriformis]|nr:hypothetical protein G9A89_007840 [Geosiphon pyriformis]
MIPFSSLSDGYFDLITIISILTLILALYIGQFYLGYFTRKNPLPGPFPLPLIGNLYQNKGHFAEWIHQLSIKHGEIFELWIGSQRQIWLSNLDEISKINQPSTKSNFIRRWAYSQGLEEWGTLHGMAYNRDLKSVLYYRKITEKAVTIPSSLQDIILNTQKRFEDLEQYWHEIGQGGKVIIDLPAWIVPLFSDLMYLSMMSKKTQFTAQHFNSLSKDLNKKIEIDPIMEKWMERFVTAFSEIKYAVHFFTLFPTFLRWTVFRHWKSKYLNSYSQVKAILIDLIRERKKSIDVTSFDNEPVVNLDMLSQLLTMNTGRHVSSRNDKDSMLIEPLNDHEIQSILLETIFGSISTTTNTFAFIVEYVGRDEKVLENIRQEIDAKFPPNEEFKIFYEDLNSLKYIQAVINETLRLSPSASLLYRANEKDDYVGGYLWESGTQFGLNLLSSHLNKKLWENPQKFIPERFFNPDHKKRELYSWGGGLRICPGRVQAIVFLKVMIVLLYRKFDIELVDADKPIKTKFDFINTCLGAKVFIKPRKIKTTNQPNYIFIINKPSKHLQPSLLNHSSPNELR